MTRQNFFFVLRLLSLLSLFDGSFLFFHSAYEPYTMYCDTFIKVNATDKYPTLVECTKTFSDNHTETIQKKISSQDSPTDDFPENNF